MRRDEYNLADRLARRGEGQGLTPQQVESLKALNEAIQRRNTKDMADLLKQPAFIRYIGRWLKEGRIHRSVAGPESNNTFFKEGRRTFAEAMLEEIKDLNFDAAYEAEFSMHRDERIRHRIINEGMQFNASLLSEGEQANDK